MAVTELTTAPPVDAPAESSTPILLRVGSLVLIALPAVVTVYLSIHSGGFFPGPPALVALVLAQLLVLRTTLAERPGSGYRGRLAIACGALALYVLWGLSSSLWSHATWRAMVGFDRNLVYLLVLVLFGSVAWSIRETRWMLWLLTLGIVGVCGAGLASRLMPDVVPTSPNIANQRLSYPLTYWNALGLVAALGVVFCLGMATDRRGPRVIRVLAAAAIPLLATTLYFTFSRGAIASCFAGVIVYMLVARSRGLVTGALAVVPPLVAVLISAYNAALLATPDPTTAAAVHQGHHVALIVALGMIGAAILRLALTLVDARLERLPSPSRRAMGVAAAVAVAGVLLAGALSGLDHRLARSYRQFLNKPTPTASSDLRARLTDPSNSYRLAHWQVAIDAFKSDPLRGTGQGTYELQWAQRRTADFLVVNAHSLYLEAMSDTGLVGILLLVVALGAILWGFARRARGPDRALYATLLAAGVAWALEAGVDWTWQMPATTVWLFALGGVALAARARQPDREVPPLKNSWRTVVAVGWLLLAATPAVVTLSEKHYKPAVRAFNNGDCITADRHALASISALSVRPEPFEILGYCDMQAGYDIEAVSAMREADKRDPHNWELQYGLALAIASTGADPSAPLAEAIALNPRETLLRQYAAGLQSNSPAQRQAAAQSARDAALASPDLSLGYI